MIRIPFFSILVLLISLALAACHSDNSPFDPVGLWSSKDGYEILLRANNTYRFCDHSVCSEGRAERPGSPGGIAVTLIDFFKHANSIRFTHEVRKLYAGYPAAENFGEEANLDFTANSGIGSASFSEFCSYKPCVLFGNLETSPNLAFVKN